MQQMSYLGNNFIQLTSKCKNCSFWMGLLERICYFSVCLPKKKFCGNSLWYLAFIRFYFSANFNDLCIPFKFYNLWFVYRDYIYFQFLTISSAIDLRVFVLNLVVKYLLVSCLLVMQVFVVIKWASGLWFGSILTFDFCVLYEM